MKKIEFLFKKVTVKFFKSHPDVKIKFIENATQYYIKNSFNIDIKKLKTNNDLYRMRINNYRVIFKIENDEIIVINVLLAGVRGEIYKNINKIY